MLNKSQGACYDFVRTACQSSNARHQCCQSFIVKLTNLSSASISKYLHVQNVVTFHIPLLLFWQRRGKDMASRWWRPLGRKQLTRFKLCQFSIPFFWETCRNLFHRSLEASLRSHVLENSLINCERFLNGCEDPSIKPIIVLSMNLYRNFILVASLLWVREKQILYLLFLSCFIFHPSISRKIYLNLTIVKEPTFVPLDSS